MWLDFTYKSSSHFLCKAFPQTLLPGTAGGFCVCEKTIGIPFLKIETCKAVCGFVGT